MLRFLTLALLALSVRAQEEDIDGEVARLGERLRAPLARTNDGLVSGRRVGNVDSWFGIPYAEPPLPPNRLAAPRRLRRGYGLFNATAPPAACPQFGQPIDTTGLPDDVALIVRNIVVIPQRMSEDCLTVSVQRPASASRRSRLPVLVWIYGGGFETGDIARYNGQNIVSASIDLDAPVVFVAVNYRLNGFGFLRGKEVAAAGASNLGLRDQRLALEWVSDNIRNFGGDPSKVTIWGESAGAGSVFAQTVINRGDNLYKGRKLFRAAIQNSGGPSASSAVDSPASQASYDAIVLDAGCANATNTLACLRSVPYDVYARAVNPPPGRAPRVFGPGFDPADNFMPVSSVEALRVGNFTRVPLIQGTQEDEGTLNTFRVRGINSTAGIVDYLARGRAATVNRTTIEGFVGFYPEDLAAGSPFGTGDKFELYPRYKQLAAAVGDIGQQFGRRAYNNLMVERLPGIWSYLATYNRGQSALGTYHGSDVGTIFNFRNQSILPVTSGQAYWISFVNHLDPNTIKVPGRVEWPRYEKGQGRILNFGLEKNVVEPDTYRQEAFEFWDREISTFRGVVAGMGKD
ncbi:Carboxylesterase-like protein 10 [Elsinoe fawcettii]|nr:Carboxylesterase-like protein 10 [Elsinoe fawcettii]